MNRDEFQQGACNRCITCHLHLSREEVNHFTCPWLHAPTIQLVERVSRILAVENRDFSANLSICQGIHLSLPASNFPESLLRVAVVPSYETRCKIREVKMEGMKVTSFETQQSSPSVSFFWHSPLQPVTVMTIPRCHWSLSKYLRFSISFFHSLSELLLFQRK